MIELNNLTTNPVDEDLVRKTAHTVLEGEGKKKADLSIAFVGQGRMRQLNKKYLGKNRTTDVLAFPEVRLNIKPSPVNESFGEVIISLRDVKKNAKRYKMPYERELARTIIHGTLHLLGYEHEKSDKEAERMFEKQNKYLRKAISKS